MTHLFAAYFIATAITFYVHVLRDIRTQDRTR